MADAYSFDIVSEVNLQETDNAINQARKEIAQRYDFKGSKSSIELDLKEKKIAVVSDDDFKLKAVVDILQNKMIKRGVPLKAMDYGPAEPASGGTVRQTIGLRVGIDKENARLIVKMIKETKLKTITARDDCSEFGSRMRTKVTRSITNRPARMAIASPHWM